MVLFGLSLKSIHSIAVSFVMFLSNILYIVLVDLSKLRVIQGLSFNFFSFLLAFLVGASLLTTSETVATKLS